MPNTTKEIISFFYSDNFLNFLGKKFNLKNVIPDWNLWGGGMHTSTRGGHLTVHSDFIYQRKTNTRRVLNLLLYLNSNWKDDWRGQIELWDKKMTKKVKHLSPFINNVLIFRTDKDSNHGYPDPLLCPENVTRKSIALYYYVDEKRISPVQIKKRKYFTTVWKKRPNSNDPKFMDGDNVWRKIKYKYLPRIFLKK
jgi:Rps23 Pro-64 3,4-dihydroxylase Tpa1-like proline 4-hydroxylase